MWNDPKILLALGGLAVGILGFVFGLLRDRWARRESRLDVLSRILDPMLRCAQCLLKANNARRTIETLKHSYPDPQKAPEAVQRVNKMTDDYNATLTESEVHYRNAEAERASRQFRLPDNISSRLKEFNETLTKLGQLVNDGMFEKADIELARFRDDYKRLADTARGWRLADPFQGIVKQIRNRETPKEEQQTSDFVLTQEEMDGVFELLHKRATTQAENTFAVHPPKKVCDNPGILESDTVIEELQDSIFSVVFQDGTSRMLSLPELMVFVYQMIVLAYQHQELETMFQAAQPSGIREVNVQYQFSMDEIMRPEMVKLLLSKINFSEEPSDD